MIAPIATLVFLATLWLVGKLVAEMIAESGGRIMAALLARPYATEATIPALPVRVTRQRVAARPLRAQQPQWRAAA